MACQLLRIIGLGIGRDVEFISDEPTSFLVAKKDLPRFIDSHGCSSESDG